MTQAAVDIGVAETPGAVGLVIVTFTVPTIADTALAWRVSAVFVSLEGSNGVRTHVTGVPDERP